MVASDEVFVCFITPKQLSITSPKLRCCLAKMVKGAGSVDTVLEDADIRLQRSSKDRWQLVPYYS
jgi:hypothetical protein